ncbi:MAG: site-2 protease family protein [Kiritimatiellia bacterium]
MIGSFYLFTFREIPVRIHFTTFFLLLWFYDWSHSLILAVIFSLLLLSSIYLHELGHSLLSQRYGVKVKDILLTPVGGVARMLGLPENPHHEIRIALAGPYVSLSLALAGAGITYISRQLLPPFFTLLFYYFTVLNTMLFLFNLLPSFPMDGGRVLRGILTMKKGMLEATRIASLLGKILSAGFILIGLSTRQTSLAIIGVIIFYLAGQEYRIARMNAWMYRDSMGPALENEFVASPPPYAQPSSPKIPSGFPGDLLITAQDLYREIRKIIFPE